MGNDIGRITTMIRRAVEKRYVDGDADRITEEVIATLREHGVSLLDNGESLVSKAEQLKRGSQ